jgi:hypothetical protein
MEDLKKLPKYSFSKLDTFDSCRQKYKIRYIDGNYSDSTTLVLELGTIAHKGKEMKGEYLIKGEKIDYERIKDALFNGIEEMGTRGKMIHLTGINALKTKYLKDYYTKCSKTGMTYDEKIEIYLDQLIHKELKDGWRVLAVEQPFEIIYKGRCILHGFIDRVDINEDGEMRVIDYKTSKALFDDSKIKTPFQMYVYALACKEIYGKYPIECIYDFIFLGKEQTGGSKGWLTRGDKKLTKILDAIDECEKTGNYKPSPTPLCYWCDFASHTPLASNKTKNLCNYHCLWTPTAKNFNKKNEYVEDTLIVNKVDTEIHNQLNPFKSNKPKEPSYNPFKKSDDNFKNPFKF